MRVTDRPAVGWLRTLEEAVLFLSLLLRPKEGRARTLYDVVSTRNWFTEDSLYLNVGYWRNSPPTLDRACEAMAELLAETANIAPQDDVLDVGFGFADQDIYWMANRAPARIVGLNITPTQVRLARERVAASGLQDRIVMALGSATAIPFANDSFDKVLALESAHHFITRDDFFRESFRVLRPGGILATADVLALDAGHATSGLPPSPHRGEGRGGGRRARGVRDRLEAYERHIFAAWPRDNWYSSDAYTRKLERVGFVGVNVRSIRHDVYPQLMDYLSRRLEDPDLQRRLNPLHRNRWLRNLRSDAYRKRTLRQFDYVVASAAKPLAGS